MRKPSLRWSIGLIAMAMVVTEVVSYALLGSRTKLDALIELLPPPSHCPTVCCAAPLKRDLPPAQQARLDDALKSRYQVVYGDDDEIPYSAWVYDCKGDVCREVEVRGVCMLHWEPTASGLFWFKSTFSKWHGPGPRTGVDETYVWALFNWVEVSFEPRSWL